MRRARIEITGIVQGIGFRPFIYRLAQAHRIRGWILNHEKGVLLDVEGNEGNFDSFLKDITRTAPPLARIENLDVEEALPVGHERFEIRESIQTQEKFTLVSPDVATCDQCLSEMLSPKDFRFHYPFLNCTLCGPRFTVIKDVPYDRHKTTMASFTMCEVCAQEYEDPLNRRFHAQTNACNACGPSLVLVRPDRERVPGNPLSQSLKALVKGSILALKGLGGFHLACDATNAEAVSALRSRKFREDKPFAVMCRDMEEVKRHCETSPEEEQLLSSVERPIAILKRKEECLLAQAVAPYQITLGIMLPYTPLHHLLLQGPLKALVMTSGNMSDEPISYDNEDALRRLSGIADLFLLHDRNIHMRCDDSVVRVFESKPYMIRRCRGYVPFPIKLPFSSEMILACGGEIKSTFCLTRGPYAFLSHHIGDLESLETLRAFEEGIAHFKKLFSLTPKAVAYDLHPDYLSTKFALSLRGLPKAGVQHHHAHIVSAMVENGVEGEVIGVALDGTGYGEDGTLWGGEFFKADWLSYERLAYLKPVPLPGGARAIREPWRMAMVYLLEGFGQEAKELKIDYTGRMDGQRWSVIEAMIRTRMNAPLTSSMGRLFDAVSSLLSVRDAVNYEGQAAIELEAAADTNIREAYPFSLTHEKTPIILDPVPLVRAVVRDLTGRIPVSRISGRFHFSISQMVLETCQRIQEQTGLDRVVLSGGVFQNMLLLSLVTAGLRKSGFKVFAHHLVPTNDGGISLGQAVVAHMRCFRCA